MTINQLAGAIPAIVFPGATLLQLVRNIRQRSAGVSIPAWLLFGIANVAIYYYAERYTEWQAIAGMLVTAVIDFAIVFVALLARRPAWFATQLRRCIESS
jgi:membrane protein YdbS with pleckstrin-like domain